MEETKKLILENKTDLSMSLFLGLASSVIDMGRISNDGKQYCYVSSFYIEGQDYFIASDLNKKSDKLTLYKNNGE